MTMEMDALYYHETQERTEKALADIAAEHASAIKKFDEFNSAHEGYAVIKEEFDELWHEIMNNKAPGTKERQRKEAIQTAAMCLRFISECC